MRRRFHHAAIAISLACIFMAGTLWIRGEFTNDELYLNVNQHLAIVGSFPNHIDFILYRKPNYPGPLMRLYPAIKHIDLKPTYWQVRGSSNPASWELAIPWWLILIFALAIPAGAAEKSWRQRRRIRKGQCPECGYDLRATPERCPECGRVAATKSAV
jgi:hypothetical protein